MLISQSNLDFTGTDQVAIAEWLVITIILLVVVTLLYKYVLNRSPSPQGITEEKLEQQQHSGQQEQAALLDGSNDFAAASSVLSQTHTSILAGDYSKAVNEACKSAAITLGTVLKSVGLQQEAMNISDMAYLIQSKAKNSPQISEPCYHLNTLRLKAAQGQPITQQEAEWAVSTASWLLQMIQNHQIVLT